MLQYFGKLYHNDDDDDNMAMTMTTIMMMTTMTMKSFGIYYVKLINSLAAGDSDGAVAGLLLDVTQ